MHRECRDAGAVRRKVRSRTRAHTRGRMGGCARAFPRAPAATLISCDARDAYDFTHSGSGFELVQQYKCPQDQLDVRGCIHDAFNLHTYHAAHTAARAYFRGGDGRGGVLVVNVWR